MVPCGFALPLRTGLLVIGLQPENQNHQKGQHHPCASGFGGQAGVHPCQGRTPAKQPMSGQLRLPCPCPAPDAQQQRHLPKRDGVGVTPGSVPIPHMHLPGRSHCGSPGPDPDTPFERVGGFQAYQDGGHGQQHEGVFNGPVHVSDSEWLTPQHVRCPHTAHDHQCDGIEPKAHGCGRQQGLTPVSEHHDADHNKQKGPHRVA